MIRFDYETTITGRLEGNNTERKIEIVVLVKPLNSFWKTLNISLINFEINVILSWSKICVITSKTTKDAYSEADLAVAAVNIPKNATFSMQNYVYQ